MKKTLLVLMILMLLPNTVFAHTGLKSSTPNDKEIISQPLTEILLEFNTALEKLSTFTLIDTQGQKVIVDNINVDENKLKGTFKSPLPNGDYTVNWKIVGEDGHVIERSFAFSVKMAEENKQSSSHAAQPEQDRLAPVVNGDNQNAYNEKVKVPEKSNNIMNYVWIALGAVVVIGILVITLRRRT